MGSSQTASKPAHSRKKTSAIKTGIRPFNPHASVLGNGQTMPPRTNNASHLDNPRSPIGINEDEDEPTTFFDINEPVVTINLNKNLQRARGQNKLSNPHPLTEDSAAKQQQQTVGGLFRKGNSMTFNDEELVAHPMQKQSSRHSNNATFLFASPTSTNTPHHHHHQQQLQER